MYVLWHKLMSLRTSLLAQTVKNPPAMRETWVASLGCEDPLDEGMATYSSSLAWRILRTEEPGGLLSMGSQRVGHNWSNLAWTHRIISGIIGKNALAPVVKRLMGEFWLNQLPAVCTQVTLKLWASVMNIYAFHPQYCQSSL